MIVIKKREVGSDEDVYKRQVIACGTPEKIASNPASYTGQYVKKYL